MHPTTAFAAKPANRMVSVTSEVQLDKRQIGVSCNTHLTNGIITPTCLQSIYGIPTTPGNQSNSALLVTAYQQFAQIADLQVRVAQSVPVIAEPSPHSQQFLQSFRPDIDPSEPFALLSIDGGANTQNAPTGNEQEANLDIQYTAGLFLVFIMTLTGGTQSTIGIATGIPLQFLSVGEGDFSIALLDTTTFLDGLANPPTVVTTSYGQNEEFFGQAMAT
jgi:tripeptidyl-peptidase-1